MNKLYLDTNQLYYIRRIAEEAEGWDFGAYEWAIRLFKNNRELVQDIRALCYIVALQYEWELDFDTSDASFTELFRSSSKKAGETIEAWRLFVQGLSDEHNLHRVLFLPDWPVSGRLSLPFIKDKEDRVILRHFATSGAGVLLTSDIDILEHQEQLSLLGLRVMRPNEWLNTYLSTIKGDEDAIDWLERVLFSIG